MGGSNSKEQITRLEQEISEVRAKQESTGERVDNMRDAFHAMQKTVQANCQQINALVGVSQASELRFSTLQNISEKSEKRFELMVDKNEQNDERLELLSTRTERNIKRIEYMAIDKENAKKLSKMEEHIYDTIDEDQLYDSASGYLSPLSK